MSGDDVVLGAYGTRILCISVYRMLGSRLLPANRDKRTSIAGWFLVIGSQHFRHVVGSQNGYQSEQFYNCSDSASAIIRRPTADCFQSAN